MKNQNKIVKFNFNSKFDESNVNRLSELKPAGTKLILESKVELTELLKLTLFDLALKQVIIIKKLLKKSHPRDPHLREYIIVETGKNYKKYIPNNFEKHFTDKIDEDSYFHLKSYLRIIYKELPSEFKYKKEIIHDIKIIDLFNINWISNLFSWIRINQKGNRIKSDITEYLEYVDKIIVNLIEKDPNKALELILFLKGNIFLLKNLSFELLENLKSTSIVRTNNDEHYDDLLFDIMLDSDLSMTEIFSDISEMIDSIDDYFNFDSGGDWNSDYDVFID